MGYGFGESFNYGLAKFVTPIVQEIGVLVHFKRVFPRSSLYSNRPTPGCDGLGIGSRVGG